MVQYCRKANLDARTITIGLTWKILYPIIPISFGFVFMQMFRGKVGRIIALPFAINLVTNLIFTPSQSGMRNLPGIDVFDVAKRMWQALDLGTSCWSP